MALENKVFSAPINIVRYNNGTMLKLASGTHEFISYNYDAEKKQGSFEPDTITITATLKGDLVIAGWKYSTDGIAWKDAVSGKNGITIGERTLTIAATSDLFADTNSSITFMCSATAGGYYDTLTITRTIDPIVMFQKTYTDIKQTKDTIELIASDDQLKKYRESQTHETMYSDMLLIPGQVLTTVSQTYATIGAVTEMGKKVTTLEQTSESITANVTTLTNKVNGTLVSDQLWYRSHSDPSQAPTSGWTTEVSSSNAKLSSENRYLWMYHLYTYNNGETRQTSPAVVGVYGDTGSQGATGRSVVSITEKYARNNDSSSVPTSWGNNVLTPTESERFVWNYEIIQYSDGTDNTDPHVIAVYGQTGRGIVSITEKYAKNNNANTAPQSGWDITVLTPEANNRYVWNREDIVYSDSATPVPTTAHIVAVYAAPGAPGAQGVGISKVEPLYYATDTDTIPSKPQSRVTESRSTVYGTWTLGIPSIDNDHPYMYMCDQITYDTSPASYNWSDVVRDNASISFQERLNSAELKITDEAIISTVRSEYGEVSKLGINLLLDTNAPTLAHVDAKEDRDIDTYGTGTVGWASISNAPEGLSYGVKHNCRIDQQLYTYIQWYQNYESANDFVYLKPGKKYTFKCYVGNFSTEGTSNKFKPNYLQTSIRIGTRNNGTTINYDTTKTRTVTINNVEWEERSATFTAPTSSSYYYSTDGATHIRFEIKKNTVSTPAGTRCYCYSCGFMVCEGEDMTAWNDGKNTMELATNTTVESQIYQSADAIRMKASTIAWEADNSSMTEDGKLICNEAEIGGKFVAGNTSTYAVEIDDNVIHFRRRGSSADLAAIECDIFQEEQSAGIMMYSDNGPVLVGNLGSAQIGFEDGYANITAANEIQFDARDISVNGTKGLTGTLYVRSSGGGTMGIIFRNGICIGWE